jgi:hypothetical protein
MDWVFGRDTVPESITDKPKNRKPLSKPNSEPVPKPLFRKENLSASSLITAFLGPGFSIS